MSEITWSIDRITGALVVEGLAVEEASALAGDLLPLGREFGCGHPLTILPPPTVSDEDSHGVPHLRVAGYYHDSLIEGPGRRTSLLVVGCTIGCRGCWNSWLHPDDVGVYAPVDRLAEALLDPAYERDGVSILGGEPMQQPEGLLALVQALKARDCPHTLVYSGYVRPVLLKSPSRTTSVEEAA